MIAACTQAHIDLEWADNQNPYVIFNIIKKINYMNGETTKKEKATESDLKQFIKND